jgi:hypothetical protein
MARNRSRAPWPPAKLLLLLLQVIFQFCSGSAMDSTSLFDLGSLPITRDGVSNFFGQR